MTAEIAIMNKEAIALASDSAVTTTGESGQKIFTSANKLFALSKYHPIGVMVYGSAIFMGIPWETIIKIYRKQMGKKKFNSLNQYARHFIKFLDNGNPLFPDEMQDTHLRSSIDGYFNFIKEDLIVKRIHSIIDDKGKISRQEIEKIISDIVDKHFEKWENTKGIPSISKDFPKIITDKYGKTIDACIKETFEELPISNIHLEKLRKIASSLFSKFPEGIVKRDISGIVIAGFGEKDIFPALESFHIEGIVNNRLKLKK